MMDAISTCGYFVITSASSAKQDYEVLTCMALSVILLWHAVYELVVYRNGWLE